MIIAKHLSLFLICGCGLHNYGLIFVMQTSISFTLNAAVVSHCFIPGLAECSRCMPARPTKRKQKARQSGAKKEKKRSLRKSDWPAEHIQHLATLRKQRQEASGVKQKDSSSEVITPCCFGNDTKQRLQQLINICKLLKSTLCLPLFMR